MPDLVFEAVVNDEEAALFPVEDLGTYEAFRQTSIRQHQTIFTYLSINLIRDPHDGTPLHQQPQVGPQPAVGGTGVGPDPGARVQRAQLGLAAGAQDAFREGGLDQAASLRSNCLEEWQVRQARLLFITFGAILQAASLLLPFSKRISCSQRPVSRRFSASSVYL